MIDESTLKQAYIHIKTYITHKKWVMYYCSLCGLYTQGIMHDLSKLSPTELFESIKYTTGTDSPINKCKAINGYSEAWLHHKGRNKHHYEYWTDNYDKGTTTIKMPYNYMLEMICDYLAAGRAYGGKSFSMKSEYNWWQQRRKIACMHPDTKRAVDIIFNRMLVDGIENTLKNKAFLLSVKRRYCSK